MSTNSVRELVLNGGGVTSVAQKVGVKPPSVSRWIKTNRVPSDRVIAVEKATGIDRAVIRPDLYPARDKTLVTPTPDRSAAA